jgi:hypothetical protein
MSRGLSQRLLPILGWDGPVERTLMVPLQLWWPPHLSLTGSTQPLRRPCRHQVLTPRPHWRRCISSSTILLARMLCHQSRVVAPQHRPAHHCHYQHTASWRAVGELPWWDTSAVNGTLVLTGGSVHIICSTHSKSCYSGFVG